MGSIFDILHSNLQKNIIIHNLTFNQKKKNFVNINMY